MSSIYLRPLIIGEMPEPNSNAFTKPLDRNITNSVGRRLFLSIGFSIDEYNTFFVRTNLIEKHHKKWPSSFAKETAESTLRTLGNNKTEVLLVGRRVAVAFGLFDQKFFIWKRVKNLRLVVIPYPTESNRWYSDSYHKKKTERFWQEYREELRKRIHKSTEYYNY